MDVRVEDKKVYIPEVGGNRDLPEAERMEADLHMMTVAERDACYLPTANGRAKIDRGGVFLKTCRALRNVSENGKPIKTAEELQEAKSKRLYDLYMELATEAIMMNFVTEDDEKNS